MNQRRRIVNAVADHGDFPSLLQLTNRGFFSIRKDACNDLMYTGFFADHICRTLIIPCQHNRLNTQSLQLHNRHFRFFTKDIGNGNDSLHFSAFRKQQWRLPLSGNHVCFCNPFFINIGNSGNITHRTTGNFLVLQHAFQSISAQYFKIHDIVQNNIFFFRFMHNRLGQRVLAFGLQRIRQF